MDQLRGRALPPRKESCSDVPVSRKRRRRTHRLVPVRRERRAQLPPEHLLLNVSRRVVVVVVEPDLAPPDAPRVLVRLDKLALELVVVVLGLVRVCAGDEAVVEVGEVG